MRYIKASAIFLNNAVVNNTPVLCFDDSGVITAIMPQDYIAKESIEHYDGLLVPGFINAHCHLELSHMLGIAPRGTSLVPFLENVLQYRNSTGEEIELAARNADSDMWQNGIQAVGDISNKADTFPIKKESRLHYHTFIETLGVNPARAEEYIGYMKPVVAKAAELGLSCSLTPHAPYSVSEELLEHIYNDFHNVSYSLHFQETRAEIELFEENTGDFIGFYTDFLKTEPFILNRNNASETDFILSGLKDIRPYILVHNTLSSKKDLEAMHQKLGECLFLCTCPKANLYIENTLPDYAIWQDVTPSNICVGTDSLASNNSLDIYDELITIQQHKPEISAETLLQWATVNSAKALSLDNQIGNFAIGKKPGAVLLPLPIDGKLQAGKAKRIL